MNTEITDDLAQMRKRTQQLRAEYEALQAKEDARQRRIAWYMWEEEKQRKLERDIALLKGEHYHDPDNPKPLEIPEEMEELL